MLRDDELKFIKGYLPENVVGERDDAGKLKCKELACRSVRATIVDELLKAGKPTELNIIRKRVNARTVPAIGWAMTDGNARRTLMGWQNGGPVQAIVAGDDVDPSYADHVAREAGLSEESWPSFISRTRAKAVYAVSVHDNVSVTLPAFRDEVTADLKDLARYAAALHALRGRTVAMTAAVDGLDRADGLTGMFVHLDRVRHELAQAERALNVVEGLIRRMRRE